MTRSTRKTGYPCVSVTGYLCDVYDHPLFMKKNSIFFNKNHILHRLNDLTGVITLPQLPNHKFLHIYWLPMCLTYVTFITHPLFIKKIQLF